MAQSSYGPQPMRCIVNVTAAPGNLRVKPDPVVVTQGDEVIWRVDFRGAGRSTLLLTIRFRSNSPFDWNQKNEPIVRSGATNRQGMVARAMEPGEYKYDVIISQPLAEDDPYIIVKVR